MSQTQDFPRMLDLSAYSSRERALDLAAVGCPEAYTAVAKKHMGKTQALTMSFMFFGSVVSHMRSLHEAVLREIANNNPHAVLPLTRAWLEVITITMYVQRRPEYIEFLLHGPANDRPAQKSFAAMFHAVREDAVNLKAVYAELSEYSHFGSLAIWNAHTIEDETQRKVSWTDVPRWRDGKHFQIACAQAHELAVAGLHYLDALGELLIPSTSS